MADQRERPSTWHGHLVRPLPSGESWFLGGGRRPTIAPQPTYLHDTFDHSYDDIDNDIDNGAFETHPVAAGSAAPAVPANARRTALMLIVVSAAAILTIIFVRRTGSPAEPAPLPTPPSHVITSVSRTQATAASIRVGDYLEFRLASGRTYSTVLEQPSGQIPVVEAMTLPGQQPQLRADSAGQAVIEVMSSPECANPDGCADQRTLVGTVELTVTP
jgi:hypothetical protein